MVVIQFALGDKRLEPANEWLLYSRVSLKAKGKGCTPHDLKSYSDLKFLLKGKRTLLLINLENLLDFQCQLR